MENQLVQKFLKTETFTTMLAGFQTGGWSPTAIFLKDDDGEVGQLVTMLKGANGAATRDFMELMLPASDTPGASAVVIAEVWFTHTPVGQPAGRPSANPDRESAVWVNEYRLEHDGTVKQYFIAVHPLSNATPAVQAWIAKLSAEFAGEQNKAYLLRR